MAYFPYPYFTSEDVDDLISHFFTVCSNSHSLSVLTKRKTKTKKKGNYIHGGFTFLNSLSPVKDKIYKLCVPALNIVFTTGK